MNQLDFSTDTVFAQATTSPPQSKPFTAFYPNTVTEMLKTPVWDLLLKRAGPAIMLHLLLHCAVFAALPNSCYIQVCGRPINDVSLDLHSANVAIASPDKQINHLNSNEPYLLCLIRFPHHTPLLSRFAPL